MNDTTSTTERHWQDWLAWANKQAVTWPDDPVWSEARQRVWQGSEYVASSCARAPDTLAELLADGTLERRLGEGEMARQLAFALNDVADETTLMATLRRFRRRQMVRIIWRDLAGWAALDETLAELTELADGCIAQTLDRLHQWAGAELGTPLGIDGRPLRLVVLGMGKLGGRELNLSSDIDLIFAFPTHGELTGPRPLTHEQFFVRLAQRLVQALDTQTSDGFVFRVDTRLRPFGDSGPLAMSFSALEDYYQFQAREWERYAMIKARIVAGDPADGTRLITLLRPFVYRRYLDFGAIDSLRELKGLIAKDLHRKGMVDNIKLGPGGIREIEFIAQAFQLIRGGRDPELQIRPLREVLARLASKGLLPDEAVRELDDAYCFLRRVENHLQAWRDRQTHSLPRAPEDRCRLANSVGFPDWTAFLAALDHHRHAVQGHFDQVFATPCEHTIDTSSFEALWCGDNDASRDQELLVLTGFADPAAALTRLEQFRSTTNRMDIGRRGRERLAELMPRVIGVIASSDTPDAALERILKVLAAVARRTAYLAMLIEYPTILAQLARLTGMSGWVSDQIARYPLLLDELIDPERLYAPLRRSDLEEQLGVLLARVADKDLEQQMENLRQFAHGNILRVAAADLTDAIPLTIVSDYLTEIAEVTVSRVMVLADQHLAARHGPPREVTSSDLGFVVLGYGKLGGIELGYGSDLDLVFIHGNHPVTAMTDGPHPISNQQFFLRLGQRMIHMLTTRTPSGLLYEVDMRLRPDGNKGFLVRSLRAFADYQANEAWTWEHQALVRARPIAGDPVLAHGFEALRREILARRRDPGRLRDEVRAMRQKMRANLDRSGHGLFDLKQGLGGIADIEFMVQYAVLRWSADHPELTRWTDNIRLLETLAALDLLPGSAASDLTDTYKVLRAAYHRSTLCGRPASVPDDQLLAQRRRVAELWAVLMDERTGS